MEEILVQNAQAYASQHQLQLAERLGFGIHGIIFVARAVNAESLLFMPLSAKSATSKAIFD